jgi:hypothetical protein
MDAHGFEACIIGEVKAESQGIVSMLTGFGGTRIVDMLAGEQLPRICWFRKWRAIHSRTLSVVLPGKSR